MTIPDTSTIGDVAEVLGITPRRVNQLTKEGMPKTGRGSYYLPSCVQWYINHKIATGAGSRTLEEQRKELLFEQTTKTRIDNEISRRELVPLDEVSSVFGTAQVVLASQLDAFGRRMAIVLAGTHDENEIESILFQECREIRRAYSGVLDKMADSPAGDGEDTEAPAPKDSKRVGRPRKNTTTG